MGARRALVVDPWYSSLAMGRCADAREDVAGQDRRMAAAARRAAAPLTSASSELRAALDECRTPMTEPSVGVADHAPAALRPRASLRSRREAHAGRRRRAALDFQTADKVDRGFSARLARPGRFRVAKTDGCQLRAGLTADRGAMAGGGNASRSTVGDDSHGRALRWFARRAEPSARLSRLHGRLAAAIPTARRTCIVSAGNRSSEASITGRPRKGHKNWKEKCLAERASTAHESHSTGIPSPTPLETSAARRAFDARRRLRLPRRRIAPVMAPRRR